MDRINFLLTEYENVSVSYPFVAGTDWSGASVHTLIADKVDFTVFIQRITLSVTTDNAATQQWQDSTGTPVPLAKSAVSPGLGPITWNFGEEGLALTEGEGLQHLMSAAGMAGAVVVQAYRRRTTPMLVTSRNGE